MDVELENDWAGVVETLDTFERDIFALREFQQVLNRRYVSSEYRVRAKGGGSVP